MLEEDPSRSTEKHEIPMIDIPHSRLVDDRAVVMSSVADVIDTSLK
jgi:hypothetical protein